MIRIKITVNRHALPHRTIKRSQGFHGYLVEQPDFSEHFVIVLGISLGMVIHLLADLPSPLMFLAY